MKIGFHAWEPGLAGDFLTAAPGWMWMQYLFDRMREQGIEPVWFGTTHDAQGLKNSNDVKEVDAMFFGWRWRMDGDQRFRSRNDAYIEQMRLMANCSANNIPFVIHDQDYKLDDAHRDLVRQFGGRITAPALFPTKGAKTLLYPNPWPTQLEYNLGEQEGIVYIGNNYERYDIAHKYMHFNGPPGYFKQFALYGNWLEVSTSGDRKSPTEVRLDFPNATFGGRLDQRKTIEVLSQSLATVHLAKMSYMRTGFIALRWLEAVAAGCPAFLPEEWKLPAELKKFGVVASSYEIAVACAGKRDELKERLRQIYETQRDFVHKTMGVQPWFDLFESLVKGEK